MLKQRECSSRISDKEGAVRREQRISPSLFLSQSYLDAWEDYKRSLSIESFPAWDYIILMASNAHQAETFRQQIVSRKGFLPSRTKFLIIPDEAVSVSDLAERH